MQRRSFFLPTAFRSIAITAALFASISPAIADENAALPAIEIVGDTPLPGTGLDRARATSNVQLLGSEDFDHSVAPFVTDAIFRALPGVSRGDQTGNPFQPELDYRGFKGSPVSGTPQGIAVYQNGARINEVFGDTVNWDFLPENAIRRLTLTPGNPVFGLNALGGAVSVEMKDGFDVAGGHVEAFGGSFGRLGAAAEAGWRSGSLAAYIAADTLTDDGWRRFSSFSDLQRVHADVGVRRDKGEVHVAFTGASNRLGSVAATPREMLADRWSSVYTWPQSTDNELVFVQARGDYALAPALTLQGNAYYRNFRQRHVDGNTTEAETCAAPGLLCYGDDETPLLDSAGNAVADIYGDDLGQIDRTRTTSNSFGGTVQGISTTPLFGRENHFVLGASVDHGRSRFRGDSELGTIDSDLFVEGTGVRIEQPLANLAPVHLHSATTYLGVYAADALELFPNLTLTIGARLNIADIELDDQTGGALSGNHLFSHVNPMAGLAYSIGSGLTMYGSVSQANRAPTPLELGCADPTRPCLIDGFLISDPPLKQVVSTTYETGLRGAFDFHGDWRWNVGAYRSSNRDDIISVASDISGFGYFLNAATTRRQGIEGGLRLERDRWLVRANYTFVDATFRARLVLSSPDNPAADASGRIYVSPGHRIPGIPAHRFNTGFEYAATDRWTLGADLHVVGSQFLIGDQSNENPKLPAYWVVNLHSSYEVWKNLEAFVLVQNLFDERYYVTGTFFETDAISSLSFDDPRSYVPGMPLAAYVGIRGAF